MKSVTVRSKPTEILEAFKASSYWMQLTRNLQKQAQQDPRAWLEGHPYLFSWYPAFFRDASGFLKPTTRRRNAASQQPLPVRRRTRKHRFKRAK